ncbi:TIGR00341 family protein [Natronorubrum texcoconense]|uniref:TIGR00341 family protein n=1 Tax=Natronorubrum texcoconense TaxID=1095776 RepID=A0A1G8UR73_9EURY|nr:TIGR00341 family protein [Natronorubrum texcoconense]
MAGTVPDTERFDRKHVGNTFNGVNAFIGLKPGVLYSSVRQIELFVPDDRSDDALSVLDDEGIDYVRTAEAGDGTDGELVSFPLPPQAVERVLSSLREAGIDDQFVVVSSIETARTPRIDELEERYVNGQEEDDSIAHEEIRSRAMNMTPGRVTYYAMTVLSAIVATAGLLLDSPAIVVGSMVIAPQVSAALTGTVGLVLDDREMVIDGLTSLAFGLGVAIVSAFVFAWIVRSGGVVPSTIDITAIVQVQNRISPGLLAIVVGICAGAAGAFGLATAIPVSLVGVMIAVALIPAAAAVGIGMAWGDPSVALGAFVLVAVNATSILFSGLAVFWYLGYRPDGWTRGSIRENLSSEWVDTLAVAVVLGVIVLSMGGLVLGQYVLYENSVNDEVRTVLDDDEYADLELVEVRTEFVGVGVDDESAVTVVVQRPADAPYPNLVADLETTLEDRTDRDVAVVVEFVDAGRSTEA